MKAKYSMKHALGASLNGLAQKKPKICVSQEMDNVNPLQSKEVSFSLLKEVLQDKYSFLDDIEDYHYQPIMVD